MAQAMRVMPVHECESVQLQLKHRQPHTLNIKNEKGRKKNKQTENEKRQQSVKRQSKRAQKSGIGNATDEKHVLANL